VAITYSNIAGQEPSTVTFRVATVVIPRGSTNEQQEILSVGDPQSSNGIARVLADPPASTEFGLVTRIAQPSVWTSASIAAEAAKASVSRSSATGVRPVCVGFTVAMAATSTTPSAWSGTVSLVDGAAGGSTYLWRSVFSLPAAAGAMTAIVRSNLWIPGTVGAPLTLEFSSSGGANTVQSVSMEGVSVNG